MIQRCRNCENLIMKKDGIYECKCYDIQMNPNFVCNDCRDRIICYVLLDRLPLIQKKCKK